MRGYGPILKWDYRLLTYDNWRTLNERRMISVPSGLLIPVGSSWQTAINANPAGTTFIIQSGVHTGQSDLRPKNDQSFYGQPGAVVDGGNSIQFAMRGQGVSGVTLDGITFQNYVPGLAGTSSGNPMVGTGTGGGWVIRNCEFAESANLGLTFSGNNNQILNCYLHHNRQSNLKGFGNNNLVQDCEISYGNYAGDFPSGGEGGGTKFLDTTNLVLRRNWVHDNYNGLWCDFDNDQMTYEYNIVEDNSDNGLFQEYGYNCIIRYNIVRRNGRGIRVTSCDNAEVYGNTVSESTSWIFAVERNHQLSGRFGLFRLRDLWVHDNTVTLTGGNTHGLRDNLQGSPLAWDPAANNRWDFNTYTNSGAPSNPFFWENNTTYTWAQWQAAGNDLNGSYS